MYVGKNFDAAAANESEPYAFDFSNDLDAGETIASATWSIAVVDGTDASYADRLVGSPGYQDNDDGDQTITTHVVADLVAGVTYRLTALATTSASSVKELHALVTCANPQT